MRRLTLALACCATACGGDDAASPDAGSLPPVADPSRDVVATRLAIDLGAQTGIATIDLAAGAGPGASLEVGDLDIRAVRIGDTPIEFAVAGAQLDLGVGADPVAVTIDYGWRYHNNADGVDDSGFTLTWPYYCGNVFPCRSEPRDGTRFELALTGVPAGATAVYPAEIAADTAAYQLAWVVGPYLRTSLGTTSAGTEIVVWHHAGEAGAAAAGTKHLRAAFDWLEQHVGPYRFGAVAGSVSAHWGGGAYGGMEHHPLWHVAADALGDESVHVHEAAHGWFGDGIRLACWEDFVLSEGAATYYEARVVEEVGEPGAGAAAWATLDQELVNMRQAGGGGVAWPASCGMVDVLTIFSRVPYVKGALFLRAVERKISRATFDQVMREFYDRHGGGAAGVTDLVSTIREIGGYDATACAASWLGERAIPTDLACP